MNLKIGDKVIVNRRYISGVSSHPINESGVITYIAYYKDMQGTISNVHYPHSPDDVYYYRVENPNDRFNVFMPNDKIKLDIQSLRQDKLTELGIE